MLRPAIRSLEKHKEFKECENAQKAIWGGLSVASEVMLVTQKAGGAVLGAFIHGKLVGFIYALLARHNGQISHWSHMMGILPEYRSQGLGLRSEERRVGKEGRSRWSTEQEEEKR